jgi:hypothetical protein
MTERKATRTRLAMVGAPAANMQPSWLSLISEAIESEDEVPRDVAPCSGGLSCELTPYSSVRVHLRGPALTVRSSRTVDVGLHTESEPRVRRRALGSELSPLRHAHRISAPTTTRRGTPHAA